MDARYELLEFVRVREQVVSDQKRARRKLREDALEVALVLLLRRVEKRQVPGTFEFPEHLVRTARDNGHDVLKPGLRDVRARLLRNFPISLDGYHPSAVPHDRGPEHDGRVPVRGAHFHDALRPRDAREERENLRRRRVEVVVLPPGGLEARKNVADPSGERHAGT